MVLLTVNTTLLNYEGSMSRPHIIIWRSTKIIKMKTYYKYVKV